MSRPSIGIGSWTQRRRFMWANTYFNMLVIAYCVGFKENELAKTAIEAAYWSNTATLLFYVFGATTQDILALRSGHGQGTTKTTDIISSETRNDYVDSDSPDSGDRDMGDSPSGRRGVQNKRSAKAIRGKSKSR